MLVSENQMHLLALPGFSPGRPEPLNDSWPLNGGYQDALVSCGHFSRHSSKALPSASS